jgi:hypothetical protein
MILWVESQSAPVIAVIAFAASYAVVLLLVWATAALARRPIWVELKATTPVMLTPLAVVTGLLIAFLAARVWGNLDRANGYVAQEAGAIREIVVLNGAMPEPLHTGVRNAVTTYLQFVQSIDWAAMASDEANLKRSPAGLPDGIQAVISFNATTRGQEIAQQQLLIAFEKALDARRNRILLSQGVISPIQWDVIVVLDLLMLVVIGMVHIDQPRTAAINMFILATAISACLVLLLVHDRPFAAGGFTLEPIILRDVSAGV